MTPYYSDQWLDVYQGDCRAVMAELPAESVHCVVTSPPYFGLRDYGTAAWEGGDEGCDHLGVARLSSKTTIARASGGTGAPQPNAPSSALGLPYRETCGKCGARRQDSQLGLEATPEEYVANMVAVFREVRRVLRNDGTVWLNLGDSYAARPSQLAGNVETSSFAGDPTKYGRSFASKREQTLDELRATGLKPKDLVGIPWRVAFALQADGWYLRSDIIWAKPNPMPESVTDRPTKAHEYLFLLSKSPRYYYDADAVRESYSGPMYDGRDNGAIRNGDRNDNGKTIGMTNPAGRNLRSVWTIATQPYPGAHFATFPRKLVEPCVKAGTSERGVCPECGAPWVRETLRSMEGKSRSAREAWNAGQSGPAGPPHAGYRGSARVETTGWHPSCEHVACPMGHNTGDASTVGGLPGVRSDVWPEGSPPLGDLLLQDVYGEGERSEPQDHQGIRPVSEGLHPPLPSWSSDGDADGLRGGAPAGDGRDTWADAPANGSGRSHQRDQGRQSPGKPARDDEEGSRRAVEPRASEDGALSRVRSSLRAQGTCGQCGADLAPLDPVPAQVLDLFAGSGTTGVVAQSLNRRAILIDLNGDYLVQAMQRNRDIPLGLVG